MEALILTEIRNQIAFLTINRPQQLNALNKDTIAALHAALAAADTDPNVGVVILTGSGEKAFVAGADIKEFADFSIAEGGALAQTGQQTLFDFIEQLGTPVIAAVNGFALGGGLELAMAAHIRIASSNAKMGLPETSLGVIPGYGGTQRLAQLVGRHGKGRHAAGGLGLHPPEPGLHFRPGQRAQRQAQCTDGLRNGDFFRKARRYFKRNEPVLRRFGLALGIDDCQSRVA